ncbi:MAG TPA: transglycosylase domain-containing protein [Kofleriaceae bacterium]|nr:transglycosylase domain-containing protein [Kofleriaceae bacterium]
MTERSVLAATVLVALGAPIGAAAWVGARTRALADDLGATGGVTARIGGVDADLTGTVRLSDVELGELFAADSIEASVALEPLLDGHIGADEIRVAAPRIALAIDRDGDSDLARLVRRFAQHGHGSGGGGASARVRRVVVASGTLTARIADVGELGAEDVQLIPDADGVRVLTGRVWLRGSLGRASGELALARAAAEVALPRVRFGRVLAVAGAGAVGIDGVPAIRLRDVAVGRLAPGGALELHASLDDGGVARAVSAELAPDDFALVVRGTRVPLAALAPLVPHAIDLGGARASGELELRRDGAALDARVAGSIDQLRLDHPTIAPAPIAITANVRGQLAIGPEAVSLSDGELELGAGRWTLSGWLRRGAPASGQLDVRLASAPCADLLASLPAEIRGPLDGMNLAGTFGGRARLAIDLAAPPGDGVDLDVHLASSCDATAEPPAADVTQLARVSDQIFADGTRGKVGKGEPGFTELRRLPSYVTGAFTAAEDARFWEHHGFDVQQIARSLEINLRDRRLARGGSTISQQLIKNAFLTQRRSLDRKIQEAILTWRLESRLDKRAILERYLNIIELGPHVFGLGAAARYWFDETPRELSVRQAAFLASLTSEPATMSHRVRHAGGLDKDSAARVDIILHAMHVDGVIGADELAAARDAAMRFAPAALRRED